MRGVGDGSFCCCLVVLVVLDTSFLVLFGLEGSACARVTRDGLDTSCISGDACDARVLVALGLDTPARALVDLVELGNPFIRRGALISVISGLDTGPRARVALVELGVSLSRRDDRVLV